MRALIIDDEPMPAKHLKNMIEKYCFEIRSTRILTSPLRAVEHLREYEYDYIFLDVEMPGMDGFELLDEVEISMSTQIIFTTAYSQYALKAFEANAVHYLLKLVKKDELIKAVRKASRLISLTKDQKRNSQDQIPEKVITIFHGDEHHIIKESDIIRLQADRSYTNFVLKDKELISSKGIGFYEKKLSSKIFFRCHNSHLINIGFITKIGKGRSGYAVLKNGNIVPISDSKKEALEKRIGI